MTTAIVAIISGALFLVALFVLHFLKRELSPLWRMISEYEIGRFGWMMRLAFFLWAASVLSLVITFWPSLHSIGGSIGRWWLVVIVAALVGAGIFRTDPITEITPSLRNTLHTICGAVVILTFPIAATLVTRCLHHEGEWSSIAPLLTLGTTLSWVGVVAYFASIIISRILDPTSGKVGPKIYQGWPNRIMVVFYVVWILLAAGGALTVLGRA